MKIHSALETGISYGRFALAAMTMAIAAVSADQVPGPKDVASYDHSAQSVPLDTLQNPDGEQCPMIVSARRDAPMLVINARGPQSTLRTLTFSPDGNRLYTAGLDKVVQVWGFQAGARGIVRSTPNQAVLVQNLRWEIARGPRGGIYDIAASEVDRRLAIAGYSARDMSGNIVVYDTATGQVVAGLEGHRISVAKLTYSPDGEHLASVGTDGELRFWNAQGESRVARAADPLRTGFRPIAFRDDDTLLAAHSLDDSGKSWTLTEYNRKEAQKPEQRSPAKFSRPLVSMAVHRKSGQWAVGDEAGNVYVGKGSVTQPLKLLRKGRIAMDMDFAPDGRLFIATALAPTGDGQAAALELWDLANAKNGPADEVLVARTEHNFAVAVSRDGSRVATYGGDDNQVLVFTLTDRNGKTLDKPLRQAALPLRGIGRKVYRVAFADDDTYRLGFAVDPNQGGFSDEGAITHAFDPVTNQPIDLTADKAPEIRWRGLTSGVSGWDAKRQGNAVVVRRDGEPWVTIPLDSTLQGEPRSYCLIPTADGTPPAIAIGTTVVNGIFVYRLPERKEGSLKLLRYYRDHQGSVMSLSVSKDGRFLASGSFDQTIKVWSLAGLDAAETPFPKASGWGASFELRDGRVTIRDVLPSGTAYRKGLRSGDRVLEARFEPIVAQRLDREPQILDTSDAETIFRGLGLSPLTSSVLLTVQRQGHRLDEQILLIPAWEPLGTLFTARDGEWAFWTPTGYYNASVQGDELFGWQLNRGPATRPDFYRADQFREELERPDVLRQLLAAGSIPEALRVANRPLPTHFDQVVAQQAKRTPIVTILSPNDGEEFARREVQIVARVDYPDSAMAEQTQALAYVNGVPGNFVNDQTQGPSRTFTWTLSPADYYNRVRVTAEGIDPERSLNFADVYFQVQGPEEKRKPKLHLFAIAAADYKSPYFGPLAFPIKDAQAVFEALRSESGPLYELGVVKTLYDGDASREKVEAVIAQLKSELAEASGDDLLLVFLAGHGYAFGSDYYFVPNNANFAAIDPNAESIDVFNAQLEKVLAKEGVGWAQLRQLADLSCRKLVMLDTCYSGNIQLEQPAADHWKAAIRPLVRKQILVVSATGENQPALEAKSLGHGVFTRCLLDGLAGPADKQSPKGRIDLDEITAYVATEVPRIARTGEFVQTPRSSPIELFEMLSVPLVTTNAEGGK